MSKDLNRRTLISEEGTIIYSDEPPPDPFTLENIRANMTRIDEYLSREGLRFERIVVAGSGVTHGPPLHALCISLALKENEEPSKEQILILDHFVAECNHALSRFHLDGTLPDEKIRAYLDTLEAKDKNTHR